MKKPLLLALLCLLPFSSLLADASAPAQPGAATATAKAADKPALVKKAKKAKKAKALKAVEKTYTCPMHPDVISHHPGRCPKCGMDLVEKK
jgi:hypothetical protein